MAGALSAAFSNSLCPLPAIKTARMLPIGGNIQFRWDTICPTTGGMLTSTHQISAILVCFSSRSKVDWRTNLFDGTGTEFGGDTDDGAGLGFRPLRWWSANNRIRARYRRPGLVSITCIYVETNRRNRSLMDHSYLHSIAICKECRQRSSVARAQVTRFLARGGKMPAISSHRSSVNRC
jgi:hypothetical protein